MALPIRTGQAGRASSSVRLGAADPRIRRNAQLATNARDVGAGLRLDKNGKLEVQVTLPLVVRNGRVEVEQSALVEALGKALEAPLVLEKGAIKLEPAGRIEPLEPGVLLSVVIAKVNEILDGQKAAGQMEG